jgi:hypothetical protein
MIVVDMDVREFLINHQGNITVTDSKWSNAKTYIKDGKYPKYQDSIYHLEYKSQGCCKFSGLAGLNVFFTIFWAIGYLFYMIALICVYIFNMIFGI